ncbi:Golgi apyrase [Podila epigama]|nr:Golgi apyrase [Podila epigama]
MDHPHREEWLRHRQFGIVIDAGSSGSRIHIYSWINKDYLIQTTPQRDHLGVLPTIEPGVESGTPDAQEWTKKTEPGIADFKDRPEDVGEHLEALLDHALKIIPESEISSTPIYLLATAGLRLVQDEIREQILANSCSYIKENYKFKIGQCKDHIKNISGQEEGIFGWVAINYLMGGFDNGGVKMIKPLPNSGQHEISESLPEFSPEHQDDGVESGNNNTNDSDYDADPSAHRHTLGFLDMGGASTQIAFEPSPKASADHSDDLTTVSLKTLANETLQYNVFVTTFLGYGSNQARRRYVKDFLLANNKDLLESEKPGVQIQIEDPCLPKNLKLSETHTVPHVPLTGSGSFAQCLKSVEKLLNKDVECKDEPCLFNGVHTPPIDFNINTFIGVSEYWYSSHDILGLGGAYDYAEFERKSAEFCNSEWDDIKDRPQYQGQLQERLEMQCFKSAWLSNVLHGGFGLPRYGEKGSAGSNEQSSEVLEKAGESIKNKNWRPAFQSINAIKDIQVTWTLGAMLLITSGSMAPAAISEGSTHSSHHAGPPPNLAPPHEGTYTERMFENYNHVMLMAIALVFGLFIYFGYRSRHFKTVPFVRRWSPSGPGSSPGASGFFGRFRCAGGSSGPDYNSLESGTGVSIGSYGRSFNPKASLKELYLSAVHHTRSVWWSISSRIWPEPNNFQTGNGGGTEEMIEAITINGFDGNSATMAMSAVGGHHGGTPAGSFGSSGLSSIPESGGMMGTPGFDGGYSSRHHSHSQSHSHSHSKPPKTSPKFFRINKKRFSGDSQSLFKDGRGFPTDGCVVNTALLPKAPTSAVELTARSGSGTNLSGLWAGNGSSNVGPGAGNSASATPTLSNLNSADPSGPAWKQGWIPEEDMDDAPMPSLLTTSRSYNSSAGHSPMLTPLSRYKQQQQEGSTSAPSSTVNLGLGGSVHPHSGTMATGFGSGFATSADEREEWSGEGDGDDEGDGFPSHKQQQQQQQHQQHQYQQVQINVQQYSHAPVRSASAVPFATNSHRVHGSMSSSSASRYKQRATGLLSGINFENGGGAMTAMDGNESASEGGGGGYQSGGSSGTGGGRHHRPSIQTTGLLPPPPPGGLSSTRSASPNIIFQQQQHSSSTSSLVLGRHNVSEADQQIVSRGSSENMRRGSSGTIMSP